MLQPDWTSYKTNIIDLLQTEPSQVSFANRITALHLSPQLEQRIHHLSEKTGSVNDGGQTVFLQEGEEKELATEVLLYRHKFTEGVASNRSFRQAALTIIQNIYLFKQRKIFFSSESGSTEQERQEAILLLSTQNKEVSVPLAKTFQHLIIARVWNRIVSLSTADSRQSHAFRELHDVVTRLNTLRNIYMLLSSGLVKKLTRNISKIYKQSIAREDAFQIGNFGIARAAYRYHPSLGIRFSTYAANWVKKEIQRQALENRLIRVSSNVVEKFAKASKTNNRDELEKTSSMLGMVTPVDFEMSEDHIDVNSRHVMRELELNETNDAVTKVVEIVLKGKARDIIQRRFGLAPYTEEQSIIEIAQIYNITRSAVYQIQQSSFKKLRQHMLHYDTIAL